MFAQKQVLLALNGASQHQKNIYSHSHLPLFLACATGPSCCHRSTSAASVDSAFSSVRPCRSILLVVCYSPLARGQGSSVPPRHHHQPVDFKVASTFYRGGRVSNSLSLGRASMLRFIGYPAPYARVYFNRFRHPYLSTVILSVLARVHLDQLR